MADTILRLDPDEDGPYYGMARATAQDARLSWEAWGLLSYLHSLPRDWRLTPADLVKRRDGGRDRMYRMLRELREHGYIVLTEHREKGTVARYEYRVRMRPLPGKPDTAEPHTANPHHTENTEDRGQNLEIPSPNGDGSSTAQTVLAAFLDRHLKLRLTPQSRARLGERIKTLLLTESESDISAGLDLYASKLVEGKAVTPAWLPGLVDEARNGRPAAGPPKGPPPPPVWKHLTPEQIRERDEQARLAIDDPVPPMRVR
jgi:hypothetical protein